MRGAANGISAAGGVLAQIGRLAADRLRDDGGIPRNPARVEREWLTAALRETLPGCTLEQIEWLGSDCGTTTRARLRLHGSPGLPRTLFVKGTPEDFPTRVFTTAMGLGAKEVAFYRDLSAHVPVRVPRVYCARSDPFSGRFVLLLEDLAAAGCRFGTIAGTLGREQAASVVRALARLHAAYWESPRLPPRERPANPALERFVVERACGPALSRFGDVVPPAVRAGAHRIHAQRDALEARWAEPPHTLVHGDPHLGNLFFDGGDVGLLDWQVVHRGPGIRDVSYFLISSLPVAERRAAERELLALYVATLAEGGVRGLGFDEAWQGHRLHALYTWIAAAVTAAAGGRLQPASVMRAAVERAAAALADLDALALLD